MKLVFINRYGPPDHSATSQILSDLVASLAKEGLQVHVVASRQLYNNPGANLPRRDSWQGVVIHRVWSTRFGRNSMWGRLFDYLSFYCAALLMVLRLLSRGDVIVAKTDPPMLSVLIWPISALKAAQQINWLQDLFPEVAIALSRRRWIRTVASLAQWVRDQSLCASAVNVVIGERMANYLAGRGVPRHKIRIIPNWAREDAVWPMPHKSSTLRTHLGLTENFVVAYSGNLGRAHDVDTIAASAQMLMAQTRIAFLIIGGGRGYQHLQAKVRQLGLNNISFLPYQPLDRLSDGLGAADLHLLSLRPELEGFVVPSKFYGICAAARPMVFIGDSDGEVARLLRGGDCGFTITQHAGERLTECILRLAEDDVLCETMGQNAAGFLESNFSRKAALERWKELLLILCDQTTNVPYTGSRAGQK